jgi:hypothetical protein
MFADFYLNWPVTTSWSLLDITTEFCCDDMKTQADSKYGNAQIKIKAGVPGTFYCWSTPQYDPPASLGYLFRGSGIRDHRYINVQIPECTVNEVIELPEIIDHVNREH